MDAGLFWGWTSRSDMLWQLNPPGFESQPSCASVRLRSMGLRLSVNPKAEAPQLFRLLLSGTVRFVRCRILRLLLFPALGAVCVVGGKKHLMRGLSVMALGSFGGSGWQKIWLHKNSHIRSSQDNCCERTFLTLVYY